MSNYTITGNLTADPELRFIPSGAAVSSFTIANTKRIKDGDDWKDGPTLFMRCSLWREQAENAAESLRKGDRVIATGVLEQRSYETSTGEKRTVTELRVDDIGPSLKNATAAVTKASKGAGKPSRSNAPASKASSAVDDPWGNSPAIGDDSEAPF